MNLLRIIPFESAGFAEIAINNMFEEFKKDINHNYSIKNIQLSNPDGNGCQYMMIIFDVTEDKKFECIHVPGNFDNIKMRINDKLSERFSDKKDIRIEKFTIHEDHAQRDLIHAIVLYSYVNKVK